MKLHTETLPVEKSGHLVESVFKIKSTAKAFTILSSALYSDKILAIVRELSCNAWDAHVAAKNTNTKFEIKLPTALDPTFYVKDYGTGLSHEDILNLYTTYFDSTKDQSNDFIGALGLGSKSPFSYVTTFSVESRHNGTKRLYSAFINEHGVPSITLLGTEKTSEPNGMTISLATKQGDAEKFRVAASKALMYFDPMPKVTGAGATWATYELKHSVKGTNWKVRQVGYGANMEGAYVVQGFVTYPIDRDILNQSGLSKIGYGVLGLDIDFTVPLGSVEIAPSREALSYTKATIENLIKAVELAAQEMRSSIQKEFDACKSLWDARVLFATFDSYDHKMYHIFDELNNTKQFTYKGTKIDDTVVLDLTKIQNTQIVSMYLPAHSHKPKARVSGRWAPDSVAKTFSVSLHEGMTVLVDDTYNSGGVMTEYLSDNKPGVGTRGRQGDARAIVIKGVSKNSYKQTEVDSLLKMFGDPNVRYVSSLPYTKAKVKSTYRARKSDEVVVWQGYPENGGYRRDQIRRVYSRLCWEGAKVDPNDKTKLRLFVELDRFTIMSKGREVSYFDGYLEAMQKVGILAKDVEVIGLNEKQIFRVKTNKMWKNLFDYCTEKFDELNKNDLLTNAVIANRVMDNIGSGVARHIVLEWKSLSSKVVDGKFKTVIDKIFDVYEASKSTKIDIDNIRAAANRASSGFISKADGAAQDLTTEFTKTIDKHAMLRLVDWSRVGSKDVDMIVEYVNFVAKA